MSRFRLSELHYAARCPLRADSGSSSSKKSSARCPDGKQLWSIGCVEKRKKDEASRGERPLELLVHRSGCGIA